MEIRHLGLERLQRDIGISGGDLLFNLKFALDKSIRTRGVTYCMYVFICKFDPLEGALCYIPL
jgi:hypothetical protein